MGNHSHCDYVFIFASAYLFTKKPFLFPSICLQYCFVDDLWVISQELTFEPGCTFLARSSFHGPNTSNEVEIEAVSAYSPSSWPNGGECV